MRIKLKVIKGTDTSYNGKAGKVPRYSLTCMDGEDPVTMLDTVDVIIPHDSVIALGGDGVPRARGEVLEFEIDSIREGFRRIELTGTPIVA